MESIKYRAWHKTEKVMGTVEVINLEKGVFVKGTSPTPDTYSEDGKWVMVGPKDGHFCSFDEVELMPWTGYKDAMGVDIYKGDIVVRYYWEDRLYGTDGRADLPNRKKRIIEWVQQRTFTGYKFGCNKNGTTDHLLVIGNIYQNPELLEGIDSV